jgi:hypothetical protein
VKVRVEYSSIFADRAYVSEVIVGDFKCRGKSNAVKNDRFLGKLSKLVDEYNKRGE